MNIATPVRLLLWTFISGGLGQAQTPVQGPVVIFLGPPGSGKSTQAAAAARRLKVPVVAVDDLIKANPSTFEKIRRSGISGMEPQSDPVLNRLFLERLQRGDLTQGMVLDGYPSTKDHADFLSELLKKGILPKPLGIQLKVPDDVSRQRAEKIKENAASVEQRIKDYHRETDMMRLYFPNAEIVSIDATKSAKKVETEIGSVLKKRFKS